MFTKIFESETMKRATIAANELIKLQDSKNRAISAIGKAAALFKIAVDTQASAMAAQAALSGIPVVGPALGKAAAIAITIDGAMRAATVAGLSFAVGTPSVPQDMVAQVHAKEGIVPKTFMDGIRENQLGMVGSKTLSMLDSLASNKSGAMGSVNVNVVMDNNTFYGQIDDNMVYNIGVRLGQMVKENLVTSIPNLRA
jgi:hypothetical protein